MKTKYSIFGILLFVSLFCLPALAQDTTNTFDAKGLKFNYPADWTLSDKSTGDKQYLLLSKEQITALIEISSDRDRLKSFEQFREIQSDTEQRYWKSLTKSLNTTKEQNAEREYFCLDLNGRNVIGERLVGSYKNEPGKGEYYSFVLGGRLLTLSYLKTDKDAAKTDPVWKELIRSLRLEGSNKDAGVSFFELGVINEGNLNSRAQVLKRPNYPPDAGKAGVSGSVLVEIVINEKGELLSSKAISGHKTLHAAAESAVRRSTFKPTTACGTPIKIKGTILYLFKLR
jgi:TonB family protein